MGASGGRVAQVLGARVAVVARERLDEAVRALIRVGLDEVMGYINQCCVLPRAEPALPQ
mgnify:CR=1 FL=1